LDPGGRERDKTSIREHAGQFIRGGWRGTRHELSYLAGLRKKKFSGGVKCYNYNSTQCLGENVRE